MSIKEQEDRISDPKRILEVKVTSKGVTLFFEGSDLLITSSTYADHFLYPGKVLSDEEYSLLAKESEEKKAIKYVSLLLSNGRYSEEEVRKRLRKRYSLSEERISSILRPYFESGILDDFAYARDFIESGFNKGYGMKYLLSQLKSRGIKDEVLSSDEFEEYPMLEDESMERYVKHLDQKLSDVPFKERLRRILSALYQRGYSDIDRYSVEHLLDKGEDSKERDQILLKRKLKECYNSIWNNDLSDKERKLKVMKKMLNLGFSYQDVKDEMDKEEYFDDQRSD